MSTSFLFTSIASMERSFLSGVRSSPVVCRHESKSVPWYLIPTRRITSNPYSEFVRRQRVSLLRLLVRYRTHLRGSWYDFIVNLLFLNFGRYRSTAHTTSCQKIFLVTCRWSASESDPDQYPTRITDILGRSCGGAQKNLYVAGFCIKCNVTGWIEMTKTGGNKCALFSNYMDCSSS